VHQLFTWHVIQGGRTPSLLDELFVIKEVASIVELFVIKEVETERKAFETERKAFTETRKVRNIRNLSSRGGENFGLWLAQSMPRDALYFTTDVVLRLAEITLLVPSAAT
jgi:hypothetical protein